MSFRYRIFEHHLSGYRGKALSESESNCDSISEALEAARAEIKTWDKSRPGMTDYRITVSDGDGNEVVVADDFWPRGGA